MRIIPYLIYLLIIAMFVVIFKDLTQIGAVALNLPALIVMLVGLYKEELPAAWFGFATGLVATAAYTTAMGWNALILAILALAACHVRERLNLDSMKAKMLVVLAGVLLHNFASVVIYRPDSVWHGMITVAPLGALYTSVFGWLFFLFKEGKITYAKIRSIF